MLAGPGREILLKEGRKDVGLLGTDVLGTRLAMFKHKNLPTAL